MTASLRGPLTLHSIFGGLRHYGRRCFNTSRSSRPILQGAKSDNKTVSVFMVHRSAEGCFRYVSPWHHLPAFPCLQNNLLLRDVTPYILSNSDTCYDSDSVARPLEARQHVTSSIPSILTSLSTDHFYFNTVNVEASLKEITNTLLKVVSPRDILRQLSHSWSSDVVTMVVEIPMHTREKMEIMMHVAGNPIMQDTLPSGKLRFFPEPLKSNYGCIPQTWESPDMTAGELNFPGDEDPIDIIELGDTPLPLGATVPTKILGALAMVDEGQMDWKVLGLRATDPRCSVLNTLADVESVFPGRLRQLQRWFTSYKFGERGTLGHFEFDGQPVPRSETLEVILEAHCHWRRLVLLRGANRASASDKTGEKQHWVPSFVDSAA